MIEGGCPGRSGRSWTFTDIYTARCIRCGGEMEFFKDDRSLPCPRCGVTVDNPRHDAGCSAWCAHAEQCASIKGRRHS